MYHVFEFAALWLLDESYAFESARCKQGHFMFALHLYILNRKQHCCNKYILCV